MAETEAEMMHAKGDQCEKNTGEKGKCNEVFLGMVVMRGLFQSTSHDVDVHTHKGKSFLIHMDRGLFGTRGEQSQG